MFLSNKLSHKLLSQILNQNYEYHINSKTGDYISSIFSKSKSLINTTFNPILNFINYFIIIIVIISFLLITNFKIAIFSVIYFLFFYLIIINFGRKKLKKNSENINYYTSNLISLLQNIFGNIRNILLERKQITYTEEYKLSDIKLRDSQAYIKVYSILPKFIVEFGAIIFIISISIYLFSIESINSFVILGTFLVAAQKLLPAFQSLYSGWTLFKGGKSTLVEIIKF